MLRFTARVAAVLFAFTNAVASAVAWMLDEPRFGKPRPGEFSPIHEAIDAIVRVWGFNPPAEHERIGSEVLVRRYAQRAVFVLRRNGWQPSAIASSGKHKSPDHVAIEAIGEKWGYGLGASDDHPRNRDEPVEFASGEDVRRMAERAVYALIELGWKPPADREP